MMAIHCVAFHVSIHREYGDGGECYFTEFFQLNQEDAK